MKTTVTTPPIVGAVSRPPASLPRDRTYAEVVVGLFAETVAYSYPTPPIRRTEFDRVGRSYRDAIPHQWVFQGWNMEEALSVQEPNGNIMPSFPSAMIVPGSPQPGMLPTRDNPVIIAPPKGSWGAKSTVTPPVSINANYLKLL